MEKFNELETVSVNVENSPGSILYKMDDSFVLHHSWATSGKDDIALGYLVSSEEEEFSHLKTISTYSTNPLSLSPII